MKKIKVILFCMLFAVMSFSVLACSNNDEPPVVEPVINITITAKSNMYVGDSQDITVAVTKDGVLVENDIDISIKSGADVLTLEGKKLTAKKSGSAVITVKYMTKSEDKEIKVSNIASINFGEEKVVFKSYDLTQNNKVSLTVDGILNGSNMTEEEIANLEYSSSDETIATVNKNEVTFLKGGKVNITAKFGSESETTCEITCIDYTSYVKIATKQDLLDAGKSFVEEEWEMWGGTYKVKAFRKSFVLTANIDLEGMSLLGENSNIFNGYLLGVFDGNNYSISNFSVDGTYSSLFGNIGGEHTTPDSGQTGVLKDLSVYCNSYKSNVKNAVLACTSWGNGVIENCYTYVDKIDLSSSFYNPDKAHEGAGFTVVNVYNGGKVISCVEVGRWVSGNKTEGIRRIGYLQNDGIFENNISIMMNMPNGCYVPEDNKSIDYNQSEIVITTDEEADIKMALDGYKIEVESDNEEIATVSEQGKVLGIAKGETCVLAKILTLGGDSFSAAGKDATIKIPVRVLGGLIAPSAYSFNKTVISWKAVNNAAKYSISVQKNNETATEINDLAATSYDIKNLLSGNGVYNIKVKAFDANNKTDGYSSSIIINGITTFDDFASVKDKANLNILLLADIDLGGKTIGAPTNGIPNRPLGSLPATSIFDGNGFSIKNYSVVPWNNLFNEVKGIIRNLNLQVNNFSMGSKSSPLFDTSYGGEIYNVHVKINEVQATSGGLNGGQNGVSGMIGSRLTDEKGKKSVMKDCSVIANWKEGTATNNAYALGELVDGKCEIENNTIVFFNMPSVISTPNETNNVVLKYSQNALKIQMGESETLSSNLPVDYKITFTSSNPLVVSVNENVLSGLSAGAATITATITKADGSEILTGKTISCTFDVNIIQGAVSPEKYYYNGSVISWDAVESATKYSISVQKNSEPANEVDNITATNYNISQMLSGSGTYTIKVKAFNESGFTAGYLNSFIINGIGSIADLMSVKDKANINGLLVSDINLACNDWDLYNQFAGSLSASSVLDGNGYSFKNINLGAWHSVYNQVKGIIRNLNVHVEKIQLGASCAPLFATSYGGQFYNVNITIDSVYGANGECGLFGYGIFAEKANNQHINTIIKNCSITANFVSGSINDKFNVFGKLEENCYELSNNKVILYNAPSNINPLPEGTAEVISGKLDSNITLAVDGTFNLTSTINGGYTLNLSSSDISVITVQDNVVTGVKNGYAYIIVKVVNAQGVEIPNATRQILVFVGDAVNATFSYDKSNINFEAVAGATNYTLSVIKDNEIVKEFDCGANLTCDISSALINRGEHIIRLKLFDENNNLIGFTKEFKLFAIGAFADFSSIKGKDNFNSIMIADIDLSKGNWDKINQFAGDLKATSNFDGNGYSIKNVSLGAWHSIFSTVKGTIRNLNLHVAKISLGNSGATLFATSYGGKFFNINVKIDKVEGTNSTKCGLFGYGIYAEQAVEPHINSVLENITIEATWAQNTVNNGFNIFGELRADQFTGSGNKAIMHNAPSNLNTIPEDFGTITLD